MLIYTTKLIPDSRTCHSRVSWVCTERHCPWATFAEAVGPRGWAGRGKPRL